MSQSFKKSNFIQSSRSSSFHSTNSKTDNTATARSKNPLLGENIQNFWIKGKIQTKNYKTVQGKIYGVQLKSLWVLMLTLPNVLIQVQLKNLP